MEKPILYLDIDGVLANFDKAMEALCPGINAPERQLDQDVHKQRILEICQLNPTVFEELEPVEGALEAVEQLIPLYDIYFLSSPMWYLPASFVGKRIWIEKHFGEKAARRLILTHRKDLCLGHYLVDDRTINGASSFRGTFVHFGSLQFPNWEITQLFLKEEVRKEKKQEIHS